MPGRMSFDYALGAASARSARRTDAGAPLRILVMGDLRGSADRVGDDLAVRKPLSIDIDTFAQVLGKMAPRLTLGGEAADPIEIAFDDLDDFHPDALYKRLPVFRRLGDLRGRMQNPATFAQAAEAFSAPAPAPAEERSASEKPEDDAATLSRLLGGGAAVVPAPVASAQSGIDAFIRNVIAEHIQPDAPPHQAQYVSALDAAIAAQMRSILHAPAFQALEATWRGVNWLITNLELGETLQVYVLDATKAEVLEDMHSAQTDLAASALYKTLVEVPSVAGAQPWSLVVAQYEFGAGGEDITLLATLGAIGSQAGAPVIGAARPALAGCASLAATPDPSAWRSPGDATFESWQALRKSQMAPWIGLAAPRMLLRLPYGARTDRVASFEFEELEPAREHDAYLWGNGAIACALLIGRAFLARGWDMQPGDELDVEDLPAHTYEEDGEKHLQACAEALLSERAGQAVLERGLIPLLSYKNRNAVRVLRFQSIAEPAQTLRGPWN